MNPPLRNVLPTSLAAVTALLAIGLAQPATAQVVPYVTDSHTLHLYHFDEAAGSGGAADTGNATHINLIDVQQVSISSGVTTGSTAGTGAAAFTGFGNSFKSGPLATDGHMAGGTGTATLATYNNNLFCGANASFTFEAIIKIPAKTPSDGQGMILGRDGQNSSRGWDFKLGPTANTLEFRPCLLGNYDSPAGFSATIPTTGADAWDANSWFHVAVTYDGTVKGSANNLKLYWTKVDGKATPGADLLASFTLASDPTASSGNLFTVGASARNGQNGSWGRETDGPIDEVRISDIARAASDMLPLAAVTNPPNAANSLVAAAPATLPADGTTTATISVTLRDGGGSPVAGKTVALVSSRGATDTIGAASGVSSGTGVVTFSVSSTTPGAPTFTATDTTDSVTVTQTASVIFTGPPNAGTSTVAAAPGSVPANGSSTSTVTVTVMDANSNPLAGKTVTLASDRGATDTISAASGVSNASGVVTFTVKSATPGTANFTATDSSDSVTVTQAASVTFTVIPPASTALSTLVASPTTQVANGSSTSTLTVTLLDSGGNPVSGKSVTLASDRGATDTISAASGASTLAGVVTFSVKSSTAGAPVFTATDTTDNVVVAATASVTFTWPALVANGGGDKTVATGIPATLGGSPAASGGSGSFSYSWSPSTALSDATAANPIASPTATTVYTLTVTDTVTTLTASAVVTVTFTVPNPNLAGVDFIQSNGIPCAGDTTLTGTTMKNAVGNTFSGQVGSWNPLNIGTYNNSSASSGFLHNAAGTATTVKLALGQATGLGAALAGSWRCSPNEGAHGGTDQLRSEIAYLYGAVSTADHYAWAISGLQPNATYRLTFFGNGSNSTTSNVAFPGTAQQVDGVKDSENDWNWTALTADATGLISGTFTDPPNNGAASLCGMQIEGTLPLSLSAHAGPAKTVSAGAPSVVIGATPAASGGSGTYSSYSWSPVDGLSDPTLANPTASPTVTTTYTLTVTDSTGASASDVVIVTFSVASGYDIWAGNNAGGQTPSEDYNHDGVQNGIAYFMGMNGLATNPSVVAGKVTWPHVGVVAAFEVEVSTDLTTWAPAAPADVDATTDPTKVVYTLPVGAPRKFCRLMVTP